MEVNIDYFIQVTFVLLILSMITEKTANFIKLRFPNHWFKRLIFLKQLPYDQAKVLEDGTESAEDNRAREIQVLTFVIGLAVSFACRANLFKLYDPDFELSWFEVDFSGYTFLNGVSDFIGCSITGIFLSFGSKFFHDLLGLLMETKNLKRKLKDRDGVANLHTIEEMDTYIAEVEPIIVESELKKYFQTLEGVDHFEYSELDQAVDVFMTDDRDQDLKEYLSVSLANKKSRKIELNYIWI